MPILSRPPPGQGVEFFREPSSRGVHAGRMTLSFDDAGHVGGGIVRRNTQSRPLKVISPYRNQDGREIILAWP